MMLSCTKPVFATAAEATIAAVYRHTCNDALAAAMSQNWTDWRRLTEMARSIAVSHARIAERARFFERARLADLARRQEATAETVSLDSVAPA